MTKDEIIIQLEDIVKKLPIEKVVEIRLSSEKEFIYFDINPKTGGWRVCYSLSALKDA